MAHCENLMETALKELEKTLGSNRVRQNEPMSLHTTFKIGGPAQFYTDVATIEDLKIAVTTARRLGFPVFILGGGSNVIIADRGIRGLVIKNNCRRFDVMRMSGRIKNQKIDVDRALIMAESGAIMNQLVRFAIDRGLSGLEYQLGLPGTVGGAVCMNSNFPLKGVYVGDCVYKARLLQKDGITKEVDGSYFRFAYDYSVLQETGEILLSVLFALSPYDKKKLWERGTEALKHRSDTQPKGASAGCTFRNISTLEALSIPTPGRVTSAGYLIDKAGLKGKKVGGAMISPLHANFILNTGDAKAQDVVNLIDLMKKEVLQKFGVHLALEVKTVGF